MSDLISTSASLECIESMIKNHPTVTEKEIRDKAIDEFAKSVTDRIVTKYCRANLTSQYIGMQTCNWIKEIAEQMKRDDRYQQKRFSNLEVQKMVRLYSPLNNFDMILDLESIDDHTLELIQAAYDNWHEECPAVPIGDYIVDTMDEKGIKIDIYCDIDDISYMY